MSELKEYHDKIRYSKDLRWLIGELNLIGRLPGTIQILKTRIDDLLNVVKALGGVGIKEKVRNLTEYRKK